MLHAQINGLDEQLFSHESPVISARKSVTDALTHLRRNFWDSYAVVFSTRLVLQAYCQEIDFFLPLSYFVFLKAQGIIVTNTIIVVPSLLCQHLEVFQTPQVALKVTSTVLNARCCLQAQCIQLISFNFLSLAKTWKLCKCPHFYSHSFVYHFIECSTILETDKLTCKSFTLTITISGLWNYLPWFLWFRCYYSLSLFTILLHLSCFLFGPTQHAKIKRHFENNSVTTPNFR